MLVIETKGLSKSYREVRALRALDLEVRKGEIFGLLGRNGAGKTTCVKILLGIVRKSGGEARLLGEPAGTVASRRRVGYLPEGHDFPDYHTPWSALDYLGGLSEMPRTERRARIPPLLDAVGLQKWHHVKIRKFSKGMKQRLGLAHAMLHKPEVIFLDEPTDGVDPVGRREIRDIMVRLKAEGHTIFLNSHLLSEVEMICDRVTIIENGETVKSGHVEELTRVGDYWVFDLAGPVAAAVAELAVRWPGARLTGAEMEVPMADPVGLDPLVDFLRERRISIRGLRQKKVTLEDVFLSLVAGGAGAAVSSGAAVPAGATGAAAAKGPTA